ARGAWPVGIFGPFHRARRPVHASLCDRAPDGGSRLPVRDQRRIDRTDCKQGGLRDGGGIFKAVSPASRILAGPLPRLSTRRRRPRAIGRSGSPAVRVTSRKSAPFVRRTGNRRRPVSTSAFGPKRTSQCLERSATCAQ